MTFDPTKPYNTLPDLPPNDDIETKAVLKLCLEATRALAELKGKVQMLPDQTILINLLPLQEAKCSSEIENIVTTQDKLFEGSLLQAMSEHAKKSQNDDDKIDPATKEILNYRNALRYGFEEMKTRPFSLHLIRDVCSVLRGKSVGFRDAGQNVALVNPQTGECRYTPPEGGRALEDKLENLNNYLLNYTGHDDLIKMALIHYQFESIHPFDDGNGRTGRIMNILYLIHTKLLDLPILYLSRFIIENKNKYYKLLRAVTEKNDWEPYLLYMLTGIKETALSTAARVQDIINAVNDASQTVKTQEPQIYSKELIETIFRQAYCRVDFLVRENIAKRQTATRYLKKLTKLKILEEQKIGREKIYTNLALIDIFRR
ncbi:MAG: Fic family protein [Opitutales bacterium]|nr:Fic family protein [Opitutales bacterium]